MIPCQILAVSKRVENGLLVSEMYLQLDISTAAAFINSSQATGCSILACLVSDCGVELFGQIVCKPMLPLTFPVIK